MSRTRLSRASRSSDCRASSSRGAACNGLSPRYRVEPDCPGCDGGASGDTAEPTRSHMPPSFSAFHPRARHAGGTFTRSASESSASSGGLLASSRPRFEEVAMPNVPSGRASALGRSQMLWPVVARAAAGPKIEETSSGIHRERVLYLADEVSHGRHPGQLALAPFGERPFETVLDGQQQVRDAQRVDPEVIDEAV